MPAPLAQAVRRARAAPALTAFAIACAAGIVVALLQGEKWFHYDSGGYWSLSETFVRDGSFSLFNYEGDGLRGFTLPLLYWAVGTVGDAFGAMDSLTVRVFNAALFALIGAILAPRLAAVTWPERSWNVSRRLVLCGLLLLFWGGYLSFPLSDFPAFALALLALLTVARSDSWPSLLLAGLCAGLAINFRPAYAFLAPALIVLLGWSWIERRGDGRLLTRRHALAFAALAAGGALVALPQAVVQERQFGQFSPMPGSSTLSSSQYRLGIELQRYETYLGGGMEYVDPHTGELVEELDRRGLSVSSYLDVLVSNPVTIAGLVLRHTVNGFDQRYTTPYVETLESEQSGFKSTWHLLLRVAGFLLLFLAILRVVWPAGRRSLGPARWRYIVALLLVVAVSAIPAAMDTRYVLPAYVVCWLLAAAPGWREALREAHARPPRRAALGLALAAAALYAVVVWTIVSGATDNLRLA